MVAKTFTVDIEIKLTPIGNPKCRVSLGDQCRDLTIDHEQSINISYQGCDDIKLMIEHYDKSDDDPTTALVISQIKINNISEYKFVYQGIYYPKYPMHLINNQAILPHQNYLGWNGVWILELTLPIYTWIHKTLDLGWIYD